MEELKRIRIEFDLILHFSSEGQWEIDCHERMIIIDFRLKPLLLIFGSLETKHQAFV